ncbi:hypothetical protein [Streptomyces sp. SPB4]|uniref:hypothetical protein n=1 Tax=Streptomyces sp. SPB4 TaxID=2940553 RepID=UPI002473804C|nr:hypothetical protein [Streptomyces sp. SPB4]MDH6539433.1 hypothetical protein [Streptomyces sp. SPB4]
MGFDEEWALLRAAAAERATSGPAVVPTAAVAMVERAPLDGAREAAEERAADFRERVVLVPLDERGGLWTAGLGGLDWICAFSDEVALARFADARGETEREWPYRLVSGARLLDEVIPALEFPCGVALDAAGPDGVVFPPMRGIVPDAAALDGEVAV